MSDTFSEFRQFITDDPLMLALCLAIALLVIVFLIVLFLGGKKKENEESQEVTENTTNLLKTDIGEEPLRSTQEFTLGAITQPEEPEKTQNIPTIETFSDTEIDKRAPISLDEVLELKNERAENLTKDTIQIPVINIDEPKPLDIPVPEPIAVEEQRPVDLINNFMVKEETTEPINVGQQTFSSVYVDNVNDIPKPITEEPIASSEIIRHVPESEKTIEPVIPVAEQSSVSEDDDDIALPKLNSDNNSSVLNSLAGESFNIKIS